MTPLKPTRALALLAAAVLVPFAAAATSSTSDPAGDEGVRPSLLHNSSVFLPVECHDAAVDIVHVEVSTTEDDMVVAIETLGAEGGPTCGDIALERTSLEHRFVLRNENVVIWFRSLDGVGCADVAVDVYGGGVGWCLGTFSRAGARSEWTLPLSGTFSSPYGGTFSYALEGETFEAFVRASAEAHEHLEIWDETRMPPFQT